MPAALPTPPPAAPAPAFANGVPVPGVSEMAAATGSPLGPLAGAAMDRRVPKRRFTPRRVALGELDPYAAADALRVGLPH